MPQSPTTNQSNKRQSRCSYCGSVNRGKGCRYAPHGVHLHVDDSTKCSYCGSSSYGRGCKVNPTSDLHVRGSVFNSMLKESVQDFMDSEFLIRQLKKEFNTLQCYKLGLIDEAGNKIRQPLTEQEHACFTPLVKTIIRLKKYLGPKVELLEAAEAFKKQTTQTDDIERYKKIIQYREKVDVIIESMFELLDEAMANGLTIEETKSLINS